MINSDKWIKTLVNSNKINQNKYELDSQVWINTIPNHNPKKSIIKYSFLSFLFIISLALVMLVKNETRNLEKDLINLKASVNKLKFDVHYAELDYNLLSSPENIFVLATQHLDLNLTNYKKSQIQNIVEKNEKLTSIKISKTNYKENLKKHLIKTYHTKKNDLKEIKQVYAQPKELTHYLKTKTNEKLKNSKEKLKNAYENPNVLVSGKAQRWAAFQVVKAFLGMPIIPGR